MKKFMILALLAAIGVVGAINKANAQGYPGFCYRHPGAPACRGFVPPRPAPAPAPVPAPPSAGPPPGGVYGFGPPPGHWRRDFDRGFFLNFGFDAPPPWARGCAFVANKLSAQGYRNVQPLQCRGAYYIYRAWRGGRALIIYTGREGRIRYIESAGY